MIELEAREVGFYSKNDEKILFSWLQDISSVARVYGQGRSIFIEVREQDVSHDDYEDFIAIFMRYDIDMRQLASLVPAESESWFRSRYSKIFE